MSPVLYPSDLGDAKWALLLPFIAARQRLHNDLAARKPRIKPKDSLFWVHFAER